MMPPGGLWFCPGPNALPPRGSGWRTRTPTRRFAGFTVVLKQPRLAPVLKRPPPAARGPGGAPRL
eukprot:7822581-Alexandrium_andersonii.AAC.1